MELLNPFRVVLLGGARQTGKTTLVRDLLGLPGRPWHARHLAKLRDVLGARFITGLVVHAGSQILPLGERILALPVSAIWQSGT